MGTYIITRIAGWPLWWYGRGLISVTRYAWQQILERYEFIGLGVWMKNLFVPMFGQYDIEGRIISFFVRLVQIIVRAIAFLIWGIVMLAVVIAWLLAPVVIVVGILYQLRIL